MGTKHVSPEGVFIFGALIDPRSNEYGTEWCCGLQLTVEAGEAIAKSVEDALANKRNRDPAFPKSNKQIKLPFSQARKRNEAGEWEPDPEHIIWNFKRKWEVKVNGELTRNTPPLTYDSTGRLCEVKDIGYGSRVKVIYDCYCYTMNGGGVKLELIGVQIAELKQRSLELAPIEGGWVAETTEEEDISRILASA